MGIYSGGMHSCATCALWGGVRKPEGTIFPAANVRVDDSERGKCMGGGFTMQETRADGTCGSWQWWPALRR